MIHIRRRALPRCRSSRSPSTTMNVPPRKLLQTVTTLVVSTIALVSHLPLLCAADSVAPVSAIDDLVNSKVANKYDVNRLSEADLLAGVTQGWLQIKLDGGRSGMFRFRYLPDGHFLFGLTDSEAIAFRRTTKRLILGNNSSPAVAVNLSHGFFMLETEVTRGQFQLFKPLPVPDSQRSDASAAASGSGSLNSPMTNVTWNEAQDFAEWLGKRVNCPIRLPTELEWEYAARGPNSSLAAVSDAIILDGNGELVLRSNFPGWIGDGHAKLPQSVPTDCGDVSWRKINDLCGSVGEWCLDVYDADYHSKLKKDYEHDPWSVNAYRTKSSPIAKPVVAARTVSVARTARGAAFTDPTWRAAAAFRWDVKENTRLESLGFRIVLVPIPIRNRSPAGK